MSNAEPRPPLLAIDTSTESAGIALYGAAGVVADLHWRAGRAQTASLLTTIDRLLRLARLEPADLGAVAVATGPGSFNALRVGLSTAKGLAYGLELPVVGVPTLDATAYTHRAAGRPIRAVVAAGRDRLASALYRVEGGWARREGDYANQSLEECANVIIEPTLVVGELTEEQAMALRSLAPTVVVPTSALRTRRAASIAELAWARLESGEQDEPATLEPIYVHRIAVGATGEATTPAHERA